jgi:release factor glutamine methyltransferase
LEINALLREGVRRMGSREYLNPTLDSVLLLSYLLNVDKIYIYTHGREEVSSEIVDKFFSFVEKRREGYPMNYILKEKEFMGLKFYIEEGVLIPRPDTEILVEYILNMIEEKFGSSPLNIVDIGAGSGCISLSLAWYIKNAFVYSIDIDDKALKVTGENIKRLGLSSKVKLLKSDLFEGIKSLQLEGKIDIIVSNPPYIPPKVIETLQPEVKDYEPRGALDGGEDGLCYYRRIIPDSKVYLKNNGIVAFEIGFDQGEDVRNIFLREGFSKVDILKDLQGLDRVIVGTFEGD